MHYGHDIAASDISPQQTAAHHSYYGARIELLKQGFLAGGSLHVYDVASAYPLDGRVPEPHFGLMDPEAR